MRAAAIEPSIQAGPSERVGRLRERIVHAPREACVERARYLTRSMAANWNDPPPTRMSKALADVLDNISVIIRDDELIVGCRTSKLKGAPFFPENKSRWIEQDARTLAERTIQRALFSDAEVREIEEEILPFWRGRTVEDRFQELVPSDVGEDLQKFVFTMMLEITYGIGHFTMNHRRLLARGLAGIIAEAREKLEALGPEERAGDKGLFYDAVIRSLEAAIRFAHRYADEAERLAGRTTDRQRAAELTAIARICRRVPQHPAASFREAIQSVYFMHLIAQIESGGNSISLGRIDQILAPYYDADVRAGRITQSDARELLALLFLKTNEIWNILEEPFIPGGEDTEGKTTQNVTVGGLSADGADATCALSYIGLEAYADVRTVQPNFGVRVSPDAPADFFDAAIRHALAGVAMHFFNDEAIVESLVAAGHTIEDARDYGVVGCLEPNAQGKTFGSTFAVQINGLKCLELALSNGVDMIFGTRAGLETGDPAGFESFDDVWNAYDRQLSYFLDQVERGMAALDQAIAEKLPSPLASAMIDGPLAKGLDLTRGGAIYNSTGVQFIGFANVADSLTAIRRAVFEDGSLTIAELARHLAEDWRNGEAVRARLLHRIPKYGNDDRDADAIAARVLEHFCEQVLQRRNYRGGLFWPGAFSVGFHIAMGTFAGASADGRHAGDILGNGITPAEGRAKTGPTALLKSVARMPSGRAVNGTNLNMRFNPKWIKAETLAPLVQTYFRLGGTQVQFNMIDTEVLRAAQRNPDAHRDLVVRISGYSALFTELSPRAQEEIISRMEYCT
jgi:pyruvate formate-lyase/glycerol dehydratase family glycyl radical enzyme